MCCLRTCFRGGLGSCRLVVGLNYIKALFQPKNDSMILKHFCPRIDTAYQCSMGSLYPVLVLLGDTGGTYQQHYKACLLCPTQPYTITKRINIPIFPSNYLLTSLQISGYLSWRPEFFSSHIWHSSITLHFVLDFYTYASVSCWQHVRWHNVVLPLFSHSCSLNIFLYVLHSCFLLFISEEE